MSSEIPSREAAAALEQDQYLVAKELSWLSFNERVLQEATDDTVPLIQRLRFLGIFANNLDEFFQVRVADVSRLAEFSTRREDKRDYKRLLSAIQERCAELQQLFDSTFTTLRSALARERIFLVDESQLTEQQKPFVTDYFYRHLLPLLNPILLDRKRRLPALRDGSLYFAIKISAGDSLRYAIVEIPCQRLPRFLAIPGRHRGERNFITLEDIARCHLPAIFRNTIPIEEIQAYAFTLTMDAELELGEGINQSLIRRVAASLKRRQAYARVERFSYDRDMPDDLLQFLRSKLQLGPYESITPGGRYHRARDFMDFPAISASLEYRPLKPVAFMSDGSGANIFDLIARQDVLLFYPYHSFDFTLSLLKTAAIDPAVSRIEISLYRLAPQSQVAEALINARRNNKSVCAVVEIQARFDEEANINWGRQLEEAGVEVIYGYPGLKVHSKLILIQRRERGRLRYYSHVGTGNFNEGTARTYSDLSLFTSDQAVGAEIDAVFQFMRGDTALPPLSHLLVSPHSTRSQLAASIEAERRAALEGEVASISIKCNNLVDKKIIQALYRASQAGVKIRIICRSMCSLVPGVPGLSENIQVINIVDRFLEHARLYIFHNQGDPLYYLSSADLMTRNLDHRIEVSLAVADPELKNQLQGIFDIQWCDNQKSRVVNTTAGKEQLTVDIRGDLRAQTALYRYISSGRLPARVRAFHRAWQAELESEAQLRRRR